MKFVLIPFAKENVDISEKKRRLDAQFNFKFFSAMIQYVWCWRKLALRNTAPHLQQLWNSW
jgi:hypothetical protein